MSKKQKNSLLWRLESSSREAPSYIFGTIHVKAAFAFEKLEPVLEALQSCAAFAAELSLDEALQNASLSQEILARPENHLPSILPQKKYKKISTLLRKALNLNLDHLAHLRPMLLMNILDEAFMPPATATEALDEHLWKIAKKSDKAIHGLETVDSQAAIMKNLAPEEEVAAFLHQMKHFSKNRQQIQKTIALYREQNIRQLYRTSYKSLGKWRYVLLKKRNHTMASRIDELASQQSVFAAVGAAHLSGKEGVLRLLKLKGYRVSPVV